ncbi:MAG: metallophosphoesterase [Candidatus Electrothrix aestuarii]|jgi:UDP-2,3-diacylglucosamine pyrophosphatase LpxH|uniref:Metallophosphoesterase n=1 Tax=Candidatus Electrothrix aestuarii TaxID=3062594 RepID=A0AAU8LXV7_9BACT|nr:metallophosphoesterase [Candidatus Electrothrix aestuarii]
MPTRTLFISDIHMGVNRKTNWYQDNVHTVALKGFLRYVLEHVNEINDLVILGDWFDQWTYAPNDLPPTITEIMTSNPEVFTRQSDGSGDFITVLNALKGKGNLRFVNGNHDMLAELQEINAWFTQHTDQAVLPGVGNDLTMTWAENTFYQSSNNKIYAEHGHLHDLFNKPANMSANPYIPLPVGHFITRTVGDSVLKQLSTDKPNSAYLKNSGDPDYSHIGVDIKVIIQTIKDLIERGESPHIAEIVLDTVLSFDKSKKLEYNMEWYRGGHPSSDAVDNYYPALLTLQEFFQDIKEIEVNFNGLDYFAKQYYQQHPEARVVVMGHTHDYRLVWNGRENAPVYINSGYYCPSIPDMESGTKLPTFVEIIKNEHASFTVNEKKITDYKAGTVVTGQTATINWEPS